NAVTLSSSVRFLTETRRITDGFPTPRGPEGIPPILMAEYAVLIHPTGSPSARMRQTKGAFSYERKPQSQPEGQAGLRGRRSHVEMAVGWPQYLAGARTYSERQRIAGRCALGCRRRHCAEIRAGGFLHRIDDPQGGQCIGTGPGHPGSGWRMH